MQVSDLKLLADTPPSRRTRVLLRLDLNVPCREGRVYDDYRIKRVLKTLEFLKSNGCRTTIVSHLDRDAGETLEPIFEYLKTSFNITFARNLSDAEQLSDNIPEAGFLLVENIRREVGEVENSEVLAGRLATLGDIFVNDAFAVLHRTHASVVGVTKFLPSYASFLIADEVRHLSTAIHPQGPSLFILGGAKFETKLPLLLKFLDRYTDIFVGGALANDLFAAKGFSLGASLVTSTTLDLSKVAGQKNVHLPIDIVVQEDKKSSVQEIKNLSVEQRIVDAGPETSVLLAELVHQAKFILWNGPLGEYQNGFSEPTEKLAEVIAGSDAKSVIGGGDTIASVSKLGLFEKFGFVSTGGGAMLEFLSKETLPGLEVLKKSL